jgi:FkbM family methyltransferase
VHEEWTTWLTAILDDPPARRRCTDLLTELFLDLVVLAEPEVFVEAGAHEAWASMQIRARLPACRVVAYEANPFVFDAMAGVHDYAGLGVDYRHQALADGPDEVTFQVVGAADGLVAPRYHGFSSMNTRHHDDEQGVVYDPVIVAATTLDAVCSEPPGSAALWVDVEGAARQVLLGGPAFLGRCDVVKIEVEDYAFWRDQWLVADVLAELHRHGLYPLARDVEYDLQYNMVLVSERLLGQSRCHDRMTEFKVDLAGLSRG